MHTHNGEKQVLFYFFNGGMNGGQKMITKIEGKRNDSLPLKGREDEKRENSRCMAHSYLKMSRLLQ